MADTVSGNTNNPNPATNRGAPSQNADGTVAITSELVREVTEKVYALLLQDLRLGRERTGNSSLGFRHRGGRW